MSFVKNNLLTCYNIQTLTPSEQLAIFNLSKRYPNVDLLELSNTLTFYDLKAPDKAILVGLIKRNGVLASIATRIAMTKYNKLNNSTNKIKLNKQSQKIISKFFK